MRLILQHQVGYWPHWSPTGPLDPLRRRPSNSNGLAGALRSLAGMAVGAQGALRGEGVPAAEPSIDDGISKISGERFRKCQ